MMGTDKPMVQTNSPESGSICLEGDPYEANAISELHGIPAAAPATASDIQYFFQQKSSQVGFESWDTKEHRQHSRAGCCCEYMLQMEFCPLEYGHYVAIALRAQEAGSRSSGSSARQAR